jgi:hypothetical protein
MKKAFYDQKGSFVWRVGFATTGVLYYLMTGREWTMYIGVALLLSALIRLTGKHLFERFPPRVKAKLREPIPYGRYIAVLVIVCAIVLALNLERLFFPKPAYSPTYHLVIPEPTGNQ